MNQLIYKAARSCKQYRHTYPAQNRTQPAFFELTEGDNTIFADWDAEIGGAVPFSVFHGRDRRYYFSPNLKLSAVNRIGREIIPLLERVRAGMSIVWNGNNHVAKLTEDALCAEREIRRLIESEEEKSLYNIP